MPTSTRIVRCIALVVMLACGAVAQTQHNWECADDGSTIAVSNSGSTNQSYTFQMNALSKYDSSLEIRVVILDSAGKVVEVIQTIPWAYGTDPTIIVGAGQSIEIRDPADGDAKTGKGVYTEN